MKKLATTLLVIVASVAPCQAVVTNLTADSLGLRSGWADIGPVTMYLDNTSGQKMEMATKKSSTNIFGSGKKQNELFVVRADGRVNVDSILYEITPLPEPATLVLLGFGCLAALPLRKRR